jgi:hypothetical protein
MTLLPIGSAGKLGLLSHGMRCLRELCPPRKRKRMRIEVSRVLLGVDGGTATIKVMAPHRSMLPRRVSLNARSISRCTGIPVQ